VRVNNTKESTAEAKKSRGRTGKGIVTTYQKGYSDKRENQGKEKEGTRHR